MWDNARGTKRPDHGPGHDFSPDGPGPSPSDLTDGRKKRLRIPLSTSSGSLREPGSLGGGISRRGCCRSGVPDRRLDLARSLAEFVACLAWSPFLALTHSFRPWALRRSRPCQVFFPSCGPPATSSAFFALHLSAQPNLSARSHGICVMRLLPTAPHSGLPAIRGSWFRGITPRLVPESEGG